MTTSSRPGPYQDLIFICYSRRDITPQLNFRELFESQLSAVNLANPVSLRFFSDQDMQAGVDWRQAIRDALAHTRVAVILEGPGLMSNEFVQTEEVARLLADAQAANGLTIVRVPVRHVNPDIVPPRLRDLQAAHPIDLPLAPLDRPKREAAMARILDTLFHAYRVEQ